MACPKIIDLPTEILNSIFSHFCLHCCHGDTEGPDSYFRSSEHQQHRLSAVELGVLLSCCTGGLTSFTYEAARSFHRPGNTSEFHPPEAIESLRVHVRTLRTLHLDLRQVVTDAPVQPMLQASLVDFTALENIFLSVNMLWMEGSRGVTGEVVASPQLPQLLPANTTSLSIAGRHRFNNLQQLSARLLGLARAVAEEGKLSRLRHVRCDSKFNRGLDDGLGPDICGIFQGAGVEFGLGCWPPSQTTITSKDVPSPLGRGTDNLMLEDFDIEEYSREEAERSTGG